MIKNESVSSFESQKSLAGAVGKILVAEAAEDDRAIISEILKSLGVEFRIVEDGRSAVRSLEIERFSLVLLDCQLPILNGIEAAKYIRSHQNPTVRDLPILGTTAQSDQGLQDKCLSAGMNEFITKPLQRDLVFEMVTRWTLDPLARAKIEDENAPNREPDDGLSILQSIDPDGTFIHSLRDMLKQNLPERIRDLGKALVAQDRGEIARHAHAIKSSTAYFGAKNLTRLCTTLESTAPTSSFDTCQTLYDSIVKESSILIEKL